MNEITWVIHKTSAIGWSETLERRYCEQSSATFEQPKSGEVVEASVYNGASSTPIQDLQQFFARVGENERLFEELQKLAQKVSDEEPCPAGANELLLTCVGKVRHSRAHAEAFKRKNRGNHYSFKKPNRY